MCGWGGVPMSHVDYKKGQCRPVEYKKHHCRPVKFKKHPSRPVKFKKHPCPMSRRPQKGPCHPVDLRGLHPYKAEVSLKDCFPGAECDQHAEWDVFH